MIIGIGTDIVEIARITRLLEQDLDFAARILGPQEFAEFARRQAANRARGMRYVATRFAAKEAFGKALGTGIVAPMTLHDLQTLNLENGQPVLKTSGALVAVVKNWRCHVSLSDEKNYAIATVILEECVNHDSD